MQGSQRPTRAKIVATLGPASESPDMVRRLIEAGASVFRLNFSHGAPADHLKRLLAVRSVAADLRRPIGVMGDLCSPKIRVGRVPDPGIEVKPGQDVILRRGIDVAATERGTAVLPISYP